MGSANNPANRYIFHPPKPCEYSKSKPRQVLLLPVSKTGQKVATYFFPAKKPKSSKRVTTIVYSHGNACDIGGMHDYLEILHFLLPNCNVVAYDYIGYGYSKAFEEDTPNEQNCYKSMATVLNYLYIKHKITTRDIILMGKSLGSGCTCEFGANRGMPFKGIILESAFTSCIRVVFDRGNDSYLNSILDYTMDVFVNIQKVGKLKCPAMLIHGTADEVVSFDHAKDMWNKLPKDKRYKFLQVKNCGHNDVFISIGREAYIKYISDFVNHCDEIQENWRKKKAIKEKILKKKVIPLPTTTKSVGFSSRSEDDVEDKKMPDDDDEDEGENQVDLDFKKISKNM